MTEGLEKLLRLLADGVARKRSALASELGLAAAELDRHLEAVPACGLTLVVAGRDEVRLATPLDLFSYAAIIEAFRNTPAVALPPDWQPQLELLSEVDSTSLRLLRGAEKSQGTQACIAEFQSAGQGRAGRGWQSPFASGICLSLALDLARTPAELGALSLAAGVAVLRALPASPELTAQLKWPNDIIVGDGKLGGILVQISNDQGKKTRCVVGVGLNVVVPPVVPADGLAPPLPARCLRDLGALQSRSQIAGRLLGELCDAMYEFDRHGFGPFIREWRKADYLHGRPVTVVNGGVPVTGVAEGIRSDGVLLVREGDRQHSVVSGDVSIRVAGI